MLLGLIMAGIGTQRCGAVQLNGSMACQTVWFDSWLFAALGAAIFIGGLFVMMSRRGTSKAAQRAIDAQVAAQAARFSGPIDTPPQGGFTPPSSPAIVARDAERFPGNAPGGSSRPASGSAGTPTEGQ
jgi:hypothetical protein